MALLSGEGEECSAEAENHFHSALLPELRSTGNSHFFLSAWPFTICKMLKVITIVFSQCTFDRLCIDRLVCTSRIKSESKGNKWTFTYPSIRINTYSSNNFKSLLPTYNFWASLTSFSEHSSIRISFAMNLWGSLKNISHYHWNTALCLYLLP